MMKLQGKLFLIMLLATMITMALSEERCKTSKDCISSCTFGGCCVRNKCSCSFLWNFIPCWDSYYSQSSESKASIPTSVNKPKAMRRKPTRFTPYRPWVYSRAH